MQKHFLILILIYSFCSGCAAPTQLRERDIRPIHSVSLAIDTTLAHDVSGTTDIMDLPVSEKITNKLLTLVTKTLTAKGFHIADQHRSAGMADPYEYYYVLATDKDRKRDPSTLPRRRGPFYSDRLSSSQLAALYKDITNIRFASNSSIAGMGFKGDASLLIQVRGRTIGSGKRIASILGNVAIVSMDIALFVYNGSGGRANLMDTDNAYYVYMRMYRTRDGKILWQRDLKTDNAKDMLKKTIENLRDKIPDKPDMTGHQN